MTTSQSAQPLPFYMNVDMVQSPPPHGGAAGASAQTSMWGASSGVSAYPNIPSSYFARRDPGYKPCPVCKKQVLHLKSHVLEHNKDVDGKYYCPVCPFNTPLSGENARHAEDHEKREKAQRKKLAEAQGKASKPSAQPAQSSSRQRAMPPSATSPRASKPATKNPSSIQYISSTNVAYAAMASSLPPIQDSSDSDGMNATTSLPSIRSFAWYHDTSERRPSSVSGPSELRLPPINDLRRLAGRY